MSMTILSAPNADFAPAGAGVFPSFSVPFQPYAAYLLAGQPMGRLMDRSGNGFHGSPKGDPVRQDACATLSDGAGFYELPFSGDALALNGAITACFVARAGADQQFPAVGNFAGAARSFVFALPNDGLFRAYATMPAAFATNGADAGRGQRWGFYAGVVKRTGTRAYERHYQSTPQDSTLIANADHDIGGPGLVRIGGDQDGSQPGRGDLAAVAIYNQELTPPYFDQIYAAMQASLAPYGVVV